MTCSLDSFLQFLLLTLFLLSFTDHNLEPLGLNDDELELNLVTDLTTLEFATEFDTHYRLLPPVQTLLVRAYSDDTDDWMLDEIKPRFIVMFEPCMEFVRRVEVCVLIDFVEYVLTQ